MKREKLRATPEFWDCSYPSGAVVNAVARTHMVVVTADMVNVERRKVGIKFVQKAQIERGVSIFNAPDRRPRLSPTQINNSRLINRWSRPEGIDEVLEEIKEK